MNSTLSYCRVTARDRVTGSFFVSIRAWVPNDFQVSGTTGKSGFRGSVVRPYRLGVAHETSRRLDKPRYSWRTRLRQCALVDQIVQRAAQSSRSPCRHLDFHYAGTGNQYEAEEVHACVARGNGESAIKPRNGSIAGLVATADTIRDAIRSNTAA
jgi:hypothetical protein